MNKGEKNEILFKIYLCYLKKNKKYDSPFGEIKNLGFGNAEYNDFDNNIDLSSLDDEDLINKISENLGIKKSPTKSKADVYINNEGYSVKYMTAGPPSIANHTNRQGFLRIASHLKIDSCKLDKLIKKYWDLRLEGKITEDCYNNNPLSPFRNNKEILRPYLEYFCFVGTGSSDSKYQAKSLIKFTKFNDPSSWKILSKKNTVDEIWDGLGFCMRADRGMPKNYKKSKDRKVIEPWTRFSSSKYRGALSIRYNYKLI